MENYGFVYLWYDRKHKRYYVGCHWGHENDGYICSSKWMKDSYKRRPNDFKRKILERIYTNKNDLLEEEYKWLIMIKDDELGEKYYNLHNHHFKHWSSCGKQLKIIEKIKNGQQQSGFNKIQSNKMKENNPMSNIETKEKRANTIRNRYPEGFPIPNKGVGHETYVDIITGKRKQFPKGTPLPEGYELTKKQKHRERKRLTVEERGILISKAKKGKPMSEENRLALIKARKEKKSSYKAWETRRKTSNNVN